MYPIAWAVVGKENKDNWKWFIFWLAQELHLGDGSKITLISDMQKGLIDAVKIVLPIDEHRFCARHILANWGKRWHGEELKKRFWICAWSTFEEEFKDNLSKLGEVCKSAAEDLMSQVYQAKLSYHEVHPYCRQ
ncbi:unnamed protein product [Cuscuta epithymum]|uniref:MULE transposase domain-containing protein n=1 Tax=Cuscuta epithymum TaxID=186058 RepID=A0AAV0GEB5_9ASTE|nr:unnamed protein product [Cuscuta epithymum]